MNTSSEWNTGGAGSMLDRFGQNERSGIGARSKETLRRSEESLREQLLDELSVLRTQHDSFQRRRQNNSTVNFLDGPLASTFLSSANLRPAEGPTDDKVVLGQSDKDAIEALFAVDDFAEMFNAGGTVSHLPPHSHEQQQQQQYYYQQQQPQRQQQQQPLSQQQQQQPLQTLQPVCRMCCKKLKPVDIAAFVNPTTFDPSKPAPRRAKPVKAK